MAKIQSPKFVSSVSLSFHKPSEEYMLEIRMELKQESKEPELQAPVGSSDLGVKVPIEPKPSQ
jgi:hypothetical protein